MIPVFSRCRSTVLSIVAASSLVVAGCTTTAPPLATVHEAFPDPTQVASNTNVPDEATKSAVYPVPFEDVFRLVNLSASQAQLNVEDVQKSSGFIFATRSTMMSPPIGGDRSPTPHRFYYVISVKELGARSTQVRIAAKIQGKCEDLSALSRTALAVGSLGITEVMHATFSGPALCERLSSPNWAIETHSAEPEMNQFMVFLRNNLLAARLL